SRPRLVPPRAAHVRTAVAAPFAGPGRRPAPTPRARAGASAATTATTPAVRDSRWTRASTRPAHRPRAATGWPRRGSPNARSAAHPTARPSATGSGGGSLTPTPDREHLTGDDEEHPVRG